MNDSIFQKLRDKEAAETAELQSEDEAVRLAVETLLSLPDGHPNLPDLAMLERIKGGGLFELATTRRVVSIYLPDHNNCPCHEAYFLVLHGREIKTRDPGGSELWWREITPAGSTWHHRISFIEKFNKLLREIVIRETKPR